MNKVFFSGRLTKDVSLSETPANVSIATFTIAVQRPYPNANGTRDSDFFNCVAFRGVAENCNKYLEKGKRAVVSGHLQNRTIEDREGKKRVVTEIIVNDVEFLEFGEKQPQHEDDGEIKPQTAEDVKNLVREQMILREIKNKDDELPF